ncbi:MAG TPA: glucoamylase family protein [Thermoanaerobaculia bacterium]|nr:glucoamylase family protein [Thermoanaerobaculia bacterium]
MTGLVPDRWPTPSFASIAATGFGLTAYPIGVARGWVTREEAAARVLHTLRFFRQAPQGPEPAGRAGHHGFFYHFLDPATGHRFEQVELSTIDTALFLGGVLFCRNYFDRPEVGEAEIRRLATELYEQVDWRALQPRPPPVAMGWYPEKGFHHLDWTGYNEAMLLYLLALGSPTFPVEPAAWEAWTSTYRLADFHGQRYLAFAPLFGHQYSHVWIDFRGILDPAMRRHGFDYFESSRRAALAQVAWARANPRRWRGLGGAVWGVTACDGPADLELPVHGETRRFWTYAGRGVGPGYDVDDGTIAPTAAGGSVPFVPAQAIAALAAMRREHGAHLWSTYGFLDAFNPTFTFTDVPVRHGKVVPGAGWYDTDYLGIDQGPILAMIENYRSGLVWRVMRRDPDLRRGLARAGFTGGWLS